MLSAKEAREQAFLMHHAHELEEIEQRVRAAIDNDMDYIYVSDSLHLSTVNELKRLGYYVSFSNGGQREEPIWLIRWDVRGEEN